MTEGLGELCLAGPMVTTGYAAQLVKGVISYFLDPTSDSNPTESQQERVGAWRGECANLPRMTNTAKVTYVGWPLSLLFT